MKQSKKRAVNVPTTTSSSELSYNDTTHIKRKCKYCFKTRKAIIDHVHMCAIFRASKDFPIYMDHDNTSYEVVYQGEEETRHAVYQNRWKTNNKVTEKKYPQKIKL